MKPRLLAAALAAALLLPRLAPAASSPDFTSADFAPGESIIFLSLPDPKRATTAWKESALYKIWQEPEVQAFFGKPISQIPAIPAEADVILGKLDSLQPRNLFAAITSFDQRKPGLAFGFTFVGGRPALDPLLEKVIEGIRKKDPEGKASVITYGKSTIEVFEGKNTVALTVADKWCFVASSVDAVKGMVDRLEKKAGVPAGLSEKSEFKSVAKRMPATHEGFWYVNAPPVVQMILALTEQSGTKLPAESRKEMEALKAFAVATSFEGGRLRDTLFGLSSSGFAPGKLSQRSMAFTTPETLLYFTSMLRFPDEPAASTSADGAEADKGAPRRPSTREPLAKFLAEMEAAGLPLREIKEAISNEASLQLDWPQGAPWPSPILSAEIKDRAAVLRLLERAIAKAGPPKGSEWKVKVEDGVEYRSLVAVPNSKPVTPSIAVTDKHILVGINPTEVRSAVVRARAGTNSRLDGTPAYKAAMAGAAPDQTLMYVDLRGLFEKAYGMARGFAPAVSDNPAVTQVVDLDKMPNTESIAKHLPPLILTTQRTEDGLLLQSSGAMTAPQLLISGLGAVGFGVNYFKAATPAVKAPPKPPGQNEEASKEDSTATPKKKRKN